MRINLSLEIGKLILSVGLEETFMFELVVEALENEGNCEIDTDDKQIIDEVEKDRSGTSGRGPKCILGWRG